MADSLAHSGNLPGYKPEFVFKDRKEDK